MFANDMQTQVRSFTHTDTAHRRCVTDVEAGARAVRLSKKDVTMQLTNTTTFLHTMTWWSLGSVTKKSTSESPDETSQRTCPVDHATRERYLEESKCPVDHNAQKTYLDMAKSQATYQKQTAKYTLSNEREVSSIPRYYLDQENIDMPESSHASADVASNGENDKHWVYPSPQQFYNAVRRKNHNAREEDMEVVVPIHNAVNEEAWRRIKEWEDAWKSDADAPSPQLVNFVGRPRDITWRAWFRGLAGYEMPFDRHDWVIARPQSDNQTPQTMRYIIDFYAGRATSSPTNQPVSFYLDVRPAPSSMEGIAMRMHRWWMDMKI